MVSIDHVAKSNPVSVPGKAALSVLDTAPEDSLSFGDDRVCDGTGAKNAGLTVVWWPHPERVYPNGPIRDPECSVRSAGELCSVLEALVYRVRGGDMTDSDRRRRDRVQALVEHPIDDVHEQLHAVPPHEVYEVTFQGYRAVCKIGTGPTADPRREAAVLEHVGSETTLPVPGMLAVGENSFIVRWVDEIPQQQEPRQTWARIAGQTMGRLHAQTAFEQTGIPRRGTDGLEVTFRDTWGQTLRSLLRTRRDHLLAAGHAVDAEVAQTALATFAEWASFREGVEAVRCHGNILPDHLRVEGEDATALIDFEHAIVGPPLYDYHRIRLPVFSEDPQLEAAFKRGYESERPLPGGDAKTTAAYEIFNGVSYLRALRIQESGSAAERGERAQELRDWIRTRLQDLRTR